MRWEQLFADLEAQYAALTDAELTSEIAERQRIEFGSISAVERLAGGVGEPLRITVMTGSSVTGVLRQVGPDWLLVEESPGCEVLIALDAVVVVDGLGAGTGLPLSVVDRKLTLRSALRGLARDRAPMVMTVVGAAGGDAGGGIELAGTIDRVGADFVELADHAAWEARRRSAVRGRRLVRLGRLVLVRSRPWS